MGLRVFGINAGTQIVITYIILDLAATYKCGALTHVFVGILGRSFMCIHVEPPHVLHCPSFLWSSTSETPWGASGLRSHPNLPLPSATSVQYGRAVVHAEDSAHDTVNTVLTACPGPSNLILHEVGA